MSNRRHLRIVLSGRSAAIMNSGGAVTTNLGNTGIDEAPSFSPSGRNVIYASKQGGKGKLTIKSLSSGQSFDIPVQGIARSPIWSSSPK
ncbi:hypothetical protein [Psychrobacter immobilis]|uniref:hypothetical protein n=1 Tax=Psychrobacter immobilis TaxID=498 RepID=UPI001D0FB97E|nr:hypothetical protein [Psychrobacter immobilis]